MNHHYKKSIYLFRRDLRLEDNASLLQACQQSDVVIPCFIFDPIQVGDENIYRSMNAMQFMIASLQDLHEQLKAKQGKLYLFHGDSLTVIEKLIKELAPDAIFCNRDYTPFSIKRDKAIAALCKRHGIGWLQADDYLLHSPEKIVKKDGKPYSVFTPYYKAALHYPVAQVAKCSYKIFFNGTIASAVSTKIYHELLPHENKQLAEHGGRAQALKILHHIDSFAQYEKTHDVPALPTTQLSAHIKFGNLSIREVYWSLIEKLGASAHKGLIRQLYWHDFYYQIAYHWPQVFHGPFHEKYAHLAWHDDKKRFKHWCDGTTGFPIVDAGMRELNETGFMHNRVRMIVASFLTKDLLINWQWGERYFAQHLVDYDPCVNNGNWQWAASTGCDPQPYFRIFNPWLQQKKFDSASVYIKRWIKELRAVDPKVIHHWYDQKSPALSYPRPIVDHAQQKKLALGLFKG